MIIFLSTIIVVLLFIIGILLVKLNSFTKYLHEVYDEIIALDDDEVVLYDKRGRQDI